jgi:hypothetical protein
MQTGNEHSAKKPRNAMGIDAPPVVATCLQYAGGGL